MNPWISAVIAMAAGVIIGVVASRIVRGALLRSSNTTISSIAGPLASLVLSIAVVVGLVVAMGFVQPGALDSIPKDLVKFVPRLVAAIIVLIGGNVVGSLLRLAAARALKGLGPIERFAPSALRALVLVFSGILAAAQLGVDTTIINIFAAAVLFGGAAAMAMLVGLGGRSVAGELAAGRAWRSTLQVGDRISANDGSKIDIDGRVIEIHPTAIEVESNGRTLLVPNSQLMSVVIERSRPDTD